MAAPKIPNILIADDDIDVIKALQYRLNSWGCRSTSATDKARLQRAIAEDPPMILLLDVRFGDHNGVELLQDLVRKNRDMVVIMMTAFGSIDSAVSAMKLGAHDYLTKPPDLNRLKFLVDDTIAKLEPKPRVGSIGSKGSETSAEETPMLGAGPAMTGVRGMIACVAPTDATVLILGESGTGKEIVARAIHAHSSRAGCAFVALNMAAMPKELVESTLFGHEKGAFTGADQTQEGAVQYADHGTLFLDEIGEMDINLQAKLLRFLQERTFQPVGSSKPRSVDTRVIAATNREPLEQVRKGTLREDLYYRLNVVPIVLPPLRSRREDIPVLAQYFLDQAARRYGKDIAGFTPEALTMLTRYNWPGNIRQLKNLVERMAIFGKDPMLGPASVPPEVSQTSIAVESSPPAPRASSAGEPSDGPRTMDQMEKQAIFEALGKSNGNVREAAKILGLGQATVYRKIKRYEINAGAR